MKFISIRNTSIDLNQALTIDEVTDIFMRINSQGVVLSQADFAMSKISADDQYGGAEIRKIYRMIVRSTGIVDSSFPDKPQSRNQRYEKVG